MRGMKKTLYTCCMPDFPREITDITFPLMKLYADKIEADFYVIKERVITKDRPELSPTLEKFQIWDLCEKHENDWNIFMDADTLINPDMFDVTTLIDKTLTLSGYVNDFVPHRFRPDKYFMRDGRMLGKGNWFMVGSDWCLDLWHPLDDITYEEAFTNIFPVMVELNSVVTREHLIDDYIVSRNIARYGLKHGLLGELNQRFGRQEMLLGHQYMMRPEEKVVWMGKTLKEWGVDFVKMGIGIGVNYEY